MSEDTDPKPGPKPLLKTIGTFFLGMVATIVTGVVVAALNGTAGTRSDIRAEVRAHSFLAPESLLAEITAADRTRRAAPQDREMINEKVASERLRCADQIEWLLKHTTSSPADAKETSDGYSMRLKDAADTVASLRSAQPVFKTETPKPEAVSKFFGDPEQNGYRNLRWPRDACSVIVKNTGSHFASAVSLEVKDAVYAVISRKGQSDKEAVVDGVIDLGNVQPGEEIAVTAWTNWPTGITPNDVRLRHNDGLGTVSFFVETTRTWAKVREFLGAVGSVAPWLLVGPLLYTVLALLRIWQDRMRLLSRRKSPVAEE